MSLVLYSISFIIYFVWNMKGLFFTFYNVLCAFSLVLDMVKAISLMMI